jgi:hypothetical protein
VKFCASYALHIHQELGRLDTAGAETPRLTVHFAKVEISGYLMRLIQGHDREFEPRKVWKVKDSEEQGVPLSGVLERLGRLMLVRGVPKYFYSWLQYCVPG